MRYSGAGFGRDHIHTPQALSINEPAKKECGRSLTAHAREFTLKVIQPAGGCFVIQYSGPVRHR
jgi:hypothetical protein